MKSDNIAAISTALAPAGVAVIRISGGDPLSVAEKMFLPSGKRSVKEFEPNKMYAGEIKAEGFTDFGLCVYFKAPKSFTGENIVEFHSHGGVAIAKGVLKAALSNGARLAERGEFTKRAFMNGKLSLASAEGLIDMINSESESGVRAGYALYREKLTDKINDLQDKLLDALSEIDADMDFPEEDLETVSKEKVKENVEYVLSSVEELISSFDSGRLLKNGVKVAIVGKPNTGKSSVLNCLLDYDKAIVSDIAGTTRDVVEGSININGITFNLYDTAGIRESDNKIENIGVELAKKIFASSDVILFVVDKSELDKEDKEIYNSVKDKNVIVVQNKSDKGEADCKIADLKVSALTKENMESLKSAMYDKAVGSADINADFLCEERHLEALKRAKNAILSALNNFENATSDILAIDIRIAWEVLGEITGKTATEEIINNIFSKFCVGK